MNIRRRRKNSAGMNIWPLVDVILMLLIFFMLTSRFITQTAHNIVLPKSTVSRKLDKEPLVVFVTKDEKIYFNAEKTPTAPAGLQRKISRALAGYDKKPSVVIKGDDKISLGLTIRLLDIVKAAGGESVDITTIKAGQ